MGASHVNSSAGHASTPVLPAHLGEDWIVALVETQSGAVATAAAGFAKRFEIPNGAGTTVASIWLRKVAASETVPDPTFTGGTDHLWCKAAIIRGADPVDPILDFAVSQPLATSTTTNMPGLVIKDQSDTLVMQGLVYATDTATPSAGPSVWTNAQLTGFAERSLDGTATAGGGGSGYATGVLAGAANNTHTGMASVTTTNIVTLSFAIAFRNATPTPYGKSGVVRINGFPAPDGGTVKIIDTVLGVIETTAVIAGGAGQWSIVAGLKFNTASRYVTYYDNGSDPPGVSKPWTAA